MMKRSDLENEFAAYLHKNPGYARILFKIREKFIQLGRFAGSINLYNVTESEKIILAERVKYFDSRENVKIDINKFINSFNNTRFVDVDFKDVLREYFNSELVTKKQALETRDFQKKRYFDKLLSICKNTLAEKWLRYVLESKDNAYAAINRRYTNSPSELKEALIKVCDGLNNLSFDTSRLRSLAIFSAQVTKDPHVFDFQSECGNLLMYGICFFLRAEFPNNSQQRSELLYKSGIVVDEISNYSPCFGVIGIKDNEVHPGWQGFSVKKEPINISLWNLEGIDELKPRSKNVYVLENPPVFVEILRAIKLDNVTIVCTSGQLNLSALILLDKLVDNAEAVYYAGDFDPEGMLIADKLARRYGSKLRLWRYSAVDYQKIKSSKSISSSRLKQLNNIVTSELQELKACIEKYKVAGFQELLIDEYLSDILMNDMEK